MNGTHFVWTEPISPSAIMSTITVWPPPDNPNTTAPINIQPPRDHGVCPSCGRCRECGRGPSEWDRWFMRPWWERWYSQDPPWTITYGPTSGDSSA